MLRVSQTIGWPSVGLLINQWFPKQHYGKSWGIISTSSRIHTVISAVLLGVLVAAFSWRIGVCNGRIFLFAGSFIFFYLIKSSQKIYAWKILVKEKNLLILLKQ